jgi:hypothetical protein
VLLWCMHSHSILHQIQKCHLHTGCVCQAFIHVSIGHPTNLLCEPNDSNELLQRTFHLHTRFAVCRERLMAQLHADCRCIRSGSKL